MQAGITDRVEATGLGRPVAERGHEERERRRTPRPGVEQPQHQQRGPGPHSLAERRQRPPGRAPAGDARGHRNGVAHQPGEAPGQEGDGPGQDGQRLGRAATEQRAPRRRATTPRRGQGRRRRGVAATAPLRSSRRRRAVGAAGRCGPGRRARRCSRARSARPIPPRRGARRGPRPHPRASARSNSSPASVTPRRTSNAALGTKGTGPSGLTGEGRVPRSRGLRAAA